MDFVGRCEERADADHQLATGRVPRMELRATAARTPQRAVRLHETPRSLTPTSVVTAETWKVVRVGEDPMTVQFEPARELREAIHSYVSAMVDLLETARRS